MTFSFAKCPLPFDETDSVTIVFQPNYSLGFRCPDIRFLCSKDTIEASMLLSYSENRKKVKLNIGPSDLHLIKGMVDNLFFMKAKPVYDYYKETSMVSTNEFIDYILLDDLTIDTYRHNSIVPWIKRPLLRTQIEIGDLDQITPQLIYDQKKVTYSPYFKRFISRMYTLLSDMLILFYVKEDGQESPPLPVFKKGPEDISWKYTVEDVITVGLEDYNALLNLLNSSTCDNRDNSDKSGLSLYFRKGNKVISFDDLYLERHRGYPNKYRHLIYKLKCLTGFYNYYSREEALNNSLIREYGFPPNHLYRPLWDDSTRNDHRIFALVP